MLCEICGVKDYPHEDDCKYAFHNMTCCYCGTVVGEDYMILGCIPLSVEHSLIVCSGCFDGTIL